MADELDLNFRDGLLDLGIFGLWNVAIELPFIEPIFESHISSVEVPRLRGNIHLLLRALTASISIYGFIFNSWKGIGSIDDSFDRIIGVSIPPCRVIYGSGIGIEDVTWSTE